MGLDSVQIVMGWEESFSISIADAEAMTLRTPRRTIDLLATELGAQDGPTRACLTLRAFHRLRHSLTTIAGVSRHSVRPGSCLRDLVNTKRRRIWEAIRSACGISSLPDLGWGSPRTVGDLSRWAVIHSAKDLKRPGEPWTRSEIRSVVRAVVKDITGVANFADDHDYIHDIRLD